MKSITTLVVRERSFEIVTMEQNGKTWFCAVEDKNIDADGRLNKKLNGVQMHASDTLEQCIKLTKDAVEMDYLMDNGKSKAEAFSIVTGMPLEICEQII